MKAFNRMQLKKIYLILVLMTFVVVSVKGQNGLTLSEKNLTKSIKVKTIKRITSDLSDDRFEGRGTLQKGGDAAANWIAEQMKKIGLKPLGDNGTYLQGFQVAEVEFSNQTSLRVNGESLAFAKDWTTLTSQPDSVWNQKMVFVGHGVVSDEIGRNDLKDFDVKGKIAVWVEGPPKDFSAEKWGEFIGKSSPVNYLLSKGAVAVVVVGNGREAQSREFVINQTARRKITSAGSSETPFTLPFLMLSNAGAEKLFAGTGMTAKAAMDAADSKDFRPMELPVKFEATFRSSRRVGTTNNVVGYFEGSDPVLKKEAVIFTAHYDGFGLMNGQIYNAAADNAIGNGEMLAVAEAFSKMKVRPKRSLIFLSTTAEEYGLRGGYHFALNPTWDITKIAANLNLDGIGTEIMGPIKKMIAFGGEHSTLGPMFNDVAKAYKITPMDDPLPEENIFMRSDHYPFVTRGVPALMLVGSPEDSAEGFAKRFMEFEKTKYHQVSDDVYGDWYWPGAKTVADIMGIVGLRIGNADEMPSYLPTSPYGKLKRGDTLK